MDNKTTEAFETVEKALRPEVTKEQLYMLVQNLHEAIECLIDDECDDTESESPEEDATENGEEIDVENPMMDKMDGQVKTDPETLAEISEEKSAEMTETEEEPKIKKSLFNNLDPYDLVKRNFSTNQRKKMAEEGKAMPDGSYPIGNKTDLMNAIRSWGRGGANPEVKAHIKRRAKALGLSDLIPANWK